MAESSKEENNDHQPSLSLSSDIVHHHFLSVFYLAFIEDHHFLGEKFERQEKKHRDEKKIYPKNKTEENQQHQQQAARTIS